MKFSTYKVPDRPFNIVCECSTMQGDTVVLFVVIVLNRGFKLEHWFWDRSFKNFRWNIFKPRIRR